jgi:hypothetical protein
LRLGVFALNRKVHVTENQISNVIVDAAIEVPREDIGFNAKTQRRKDATQAGEEASL